jgi:hypothetical protein
VTILPYALRHMYDKHFLGMTKVVQWLEDQGVVINHKRHILQSTQLNLHIRHDNDYIEVGPYTDDPNGEMFHCYTAQVVRFDVPCELLPKVMLAVKEHQGIGQKRIADNIQIKTHVTNQFIMQKHIFANDYSWKKVEITLEFRVYHEFKEV